MAGDGPGLVRLGDLDWWVQGDLKSFGSGTGRGLTVVCACGRDCRVVGTATMGPRLAGFDVVFAAGPVVVTGVEFERRGAPRALGLVTTAALLRTP
jgi:hypothetical protein